MISHQRTQMTNTRITNTTIDTSDVRWAGLKNQAERADGVEMEGNRLSFDTPEAAADFADKARTFAVAHGWAGAPAKARTIRKLAHEIDDVMGCGVDR